MLVIVKSHENPMFDAQNPWKSHKTSGSKNQIWDGWTLLLTLDRPDGAQTVATENRQGTLLWRTMSLGNLRGRSVFSFFFGDTPEFGWVKIMWNRSLEFSGHIILQCFFLSKCTCVGRVRFLFILKRVSRVWNHWDYLTMEPSAEWQISSSFCLIFSDVSMFALRPIWNIQPYLFKRCFYPLVISHSYWTWPFIVDLPNENGDFPISYVNVYQRVDDLHSPWLFPHLKF